MDIFDIERELSILIDTDKKAWVQMYLLLNKVEQEKLWKSTHNRFGAWLSHYAKKKNINESLLWHRRQAGRFYSKFAERAALQHHDVTKIEEINIPPDSLNIAERIAAKDDAVADELIGKLLNNEITRQELLSVLKLMPRPKRNRSDLKLSLIVILLLRSERLRLGILSCC